MKYKEMISILVLAAALIVGIPACDKLFGDSDVATFDISDWGFREYLGAQLESPFELSTANVPLPANIRQYIKSMDNYMYESNSITLMISRVEYVDGMTLDLDGAVNGATQNMRTSKGISNFSYEAKPLFKNTYEGRFIKGKCTVKGKPAEFVAELYKNDLKMMQVYCLYLKHDENRDVQERIMKSLRVTL